MRLPSAFAMLAGLAGCALQPTPRYPRPSLPLPERAIAAPQLTLLDNRDRSHITGMLSGEGEQVRFELWRATGSEPRPLVLLVPILAGGRELMVTLARGMLDHGFDAVFCERAGSAMTPPQRGADLDDLFRRTVLHQRLTLAWLRAADDPPPAIHVLGVSMGGIVSTVLAAAEPDLDGIAICLAGADLPDLVTRSSEGRVRRWVDWRRSTDGIGRDALLWELRQSFSHEPYRYAPGVATDKVLFVSAAMDSVVPRRNQDLLWEAFGRPERLDLPLGHYTAAAALERVISAAAAHFRRHSPDGTRSIPDPCTLPGMSL